MNEKLSVENYIGCILGGAVGDALGAPTEFMSLNQILIQYGQIGVNDYVEFSDGKGVITDDTQMLLFTAEGILRSKHRAVNRGIGGAYTKICYQSYLRWLHTQDDWYSEQVLQNALLDGWLLKEKLLYKRRAPGNTCLTALRSGHCGTMEQPINNSKGCGGIMRIAPVGLMFHGQATTAFRIGAELAAMTHGHPSGYLSAGYFSALIAYINNGMSLLDAIEKSKEILSSYANCEETEIAVNKAIKLFKTSSPSYQNVETLGGGWVGEEALAIALYCSLCYQDDFGKAINLSINHSGDTDSTGSLTGNIVGLILGESNIPKRWKENLELEPLIREIATDLHFEVEGNGHDYSDKIWSEKYPDY